MREQHDPQRLTAAVPTVPSIMLSYGKQSIDDDDIEAVVNVLKSDWLTTGPCVDAFEEACASFVGAKYAVAVSSGTAALHAAMHAIGIGPKDEVIVPALTFLPTANCIVFQGGTPVFCDVDEETMLIDSSYVERLITDKTKAIIAVDYAGRPCDYDALGRIAKERGLYLVDDASHALGARYKGRRVGAVTDLTTFSMHPVKIITSGEGGIVTTDSEAWADSMRSFRNHGVRKAEGGGYEMQELGYNYRLTDFQSALGHSQLKKADAWIERRQEIARRYTDAFADLACVETPGTDADASSAWHLYVLRVDFKGLGKSRADGMAALREAGIGTQIHYLPVHLHPFYRERFGTGEGLCPVAERLYQEILSIPIYPAMTDDDVEHVIGAVKSTLG